MNKRIILILIFLLSCKLFGGNSLIIGFGTDNSMLTLNLGYRLDLNRDFFNKDSNVTFGLKTPLLRPGLDDFTIYSLYELKTINMDILELPLSVGVNLKGVSNAGYRGLGFGPEITLKPQFKIGEFGTGLELLWDSSLITYIRPTDKYLNYVNPHSKGGLYLNRSNSYRVGLLLDYTGLSGKRIFLNGGYQYNGGYSKVPPIYGFGGSEISL